jgi:hypothetical protein
MLDLNEDPALHAEMQYNTSAAVGHRRSAIQPRLPSQHAQATAVHIAISSQLRLPGCISCSSTSPFTYSTSQMRPSKLVCSSVIH